MKKEVLRIHNVSCACSRARRLESVSLCAMEGESTGFLGLTDSGKDLLVGLLCGQLWEGEVEGAIYLNGQRLQDIPSLKEQVYYLNADNYIIDDWTVAEYIGLVESGWLQNIWRRKKLREEVSAYFDALMLPLDVSRRIRDLSELEKRIVDMVKACWKGSRILVVEDEFEGMRPESIERFACIMHRLLQGRMTAVVNSHSDMVSSLLSDYYVIFKKGRIVKKCCKEYIQNASHLEAFLLGTSIISQKKNLDSYALEQSDDGEIVYRFKGFLWKGNRREEFCFERGKVTTLLVLDGRERERLFQLLSGRGAERGTYCLLEGKWLEGVEISEIVRRKVVSVMHIGTMEEVFGSLNVGENLLLPSLCKISSLDYVTSSSQLFRMLKQSGEGLPALAGEPAKDLEVNDLIRLTLERWYIYNPRVLVLLEPFVRCDMYGVSIVKSYIKKFANKGTAVIVIKSREEYMEDISDRIISLD